VSPQNIGYANVSAPDRKGERCCSKLILPGIYVGAMLEQQFG
jgi:hypothetical protein